MQMTAVPLDKLDRLVQRWEEIQAELNRGPNPATYAKLSKEFAELNPVVATIQAQQKAEAERRDLLEIIDDPASDRGLKELANEDLPGVEQRLQQLREEL